MNARGLQQNRAELLEQNNAFFKITISASMLVCVSISMCKYVCVCVGACLSMCQCLCQCVCVGVSA
jgi:hypothetical protein